jgi:hypothetical protein
MDGWIKLVQFITQAFGLPGSIAVAIAGYVIYLLQQERASHLATRDKIDAINEKRIEATAATVKIVEDLKDSLRAVTAILEKPK